jgi:hypothetical protein
MRVEVLWKTELSHREKERIWIAARKGVLAKGGERPPWTWLSPDAASGGSLFGELPGTTQCP